MLAHLKSTWYPNPKPYMTGWRYFWNSLAVHCTVPLNSDHISANLARLDWFFKLTRTMNRVELDYKLNPQLDFDARAYFTTLSVSLLSAINTYLAKFARYLKLSHFAWWWPLQCIVGKLCLWLIYCWRRWILWILWILVDYPPEGEFSLKGLLRQTD